jgi:hypothetical protein
MTAPPVPDDQSAVGRRETNSDTHPAVTVARAVADVTATTAVDLPPVGQVIDTDTLENVIAGRFVYNHLTFLYFGFRICVHSEGWVRVHDSE